jgi:hypothetical protein
MMHTNKQQNHARGRAALVLALIGLISPTGLVKDPISPASARADAQVWTNTGSPNTTDHRTAFLLPNGKVLVVGGRSAELYDPSTGTWSLTGSLNVSRMGYTATLLGNGKVLVAGGDSYSQQSDLTNTAELYDPATGEWSFTGNFNVRRAYPTATLLSNGKVLFAGGSAADSAAELYDPATGKWSLTGNLTGTRVGHAATRLQDGKVLVAGGCESEDCNYFPGSAEIYDPNTETWSITGSLNAPRIGHTLTTLANGNVLLPGGFRESFSSSSSFFETVDTVELYNPATGLWSYTGSPRNYRSGAPVTLPSGQVLVVGGWYSGVELYNPATGKWNTTASPNTVRDASTATLLSDGNVLVVEGQSAELYHPGVLDPAPTAPRIILASVAGKKLFITGENFHDGAVILLNGEEQKSRNNEQYPGTNLIGKRAGKNIKPGDRVQVRNPDGTLSAEFIFTGS